MIRIKSILIATLFLSSSTVLLGQSDSTSRSESKKSSKNNQTSSKQSLLGAFLAFPMGEFGKTDIENGGFAKQGYGFSFDSKSMIGKGFSYLFHTTYAWADIDGDAMAKAFDKEFETNLGTGYKTSVTGGQHQPFLSTIGLGYDFHLTERISFGLNGQAGIVYNSFRPMTIKVYDSNINQEIYNDIVSYESSFAFAYGFGADIMFTLIPNLIAFQLNADYSSGKLDTYLISKVFDPIKSVEKMQFLNLGFSLVFYTN
jgi:hypothetical protein